MSLWTYFLPRRIASSRPIGQRLRAEPLFFHRCRHDAAERVGGIRDQNDALFSVFLLVLYRVRIREGMDRSFLVLFSLHPDCLDKGPDTDPERSLDLTLVEL